MIPSVTHGHAYPIKKKPSVLIQTNRLREDKIYDDIWHNNPKWKPEKSNLIYNDYNWKLYIRQNCWKQTFKYEISNIWTRSMIFIISRQHMNFHTSISALWETIHTRDSNTAIYSYEHEEHKYCPDSGSTEQRNEKCLLIMWLQFQGYLTRNFLDSMKKL